MDSNRRIPINVSNSPSDYSGRSYRLGGQTDIRDKMNQRMREFEEESRKWREQFLGSATPLDRPRMFFNFPEFPELSPSFNSPLSSRLTGPASFFPSSSSTLQPLAPSSHKSFLEEDDHGQKKFKITFEIGDFKPSEIQVKTDGRQLVVKGDREIQAGSAVESKQFNREITLPDFVEPTSVQSFLADGVLTVEAPVQLDRLSYSSSGNNNNQSLRHSPLRDNQSPARSATTTTSSSTGNYSRNPPAPLQSNYGFGDNQQSKSQQPVVYKFNMGEFRPEDIAITVTDTTLKVHAVREENDQYSTGNTYREFKREIGLPYGADVKRLSNKLQSDGLLVIEIPVVDNAGLRPPLSPTNVAKQFNNFSLEDNNNSRTSSTATSAVQAAPTTALTNTGGLINSVNDGKELRLTFDLTGYKPEDLSIKVIDTNTLKIHAVHIDNTRGNQIHREYTRQYQLPDWVQPEHLRARMSDQGTLTVEVPVPQIQPSKYERLINIQNH